MKEQPQDKRLASLLEYAGKSGASRVTCLTPNCVVVEDALAECCITPKCPFWGQSLSCPPQVSGPKGFRKLLQKSSSVLLVCLEVQACSLLGEERPQVMRLLHEMVAAIEIQAKEIGFTNAMGFAAGSCKPSFCADRENCHALTDNGKCLFPDQARASLSGYGVNVGKLMESAGWSNALFEQERPGAEPLSWVAGLVLLAESNV